MDLQGRDEGFSILCELSDRQFDPIAKNRIKGLIGKPNEEVKDLLLGIIDDCTFAALCSDFEIMIMHTIWMSIGGSEAELQERNRLLDNKEVREQMRERFKWKCCV